MADTFTLLYTPLLREVFTKQAQQQIEQGVDALLAAREYAELGKPDFTLAFLLLIEQADEEKREILAHAYERRAALAEEKARAYTTQFHQPFPLIKLAARKDLLAARTIREGQPLPEEKRPSLQ